MRSIAGAPATSASLESFAMKTYVERELDARGRVEVMKRPRVDFTQILDIVRPIVDAVSARGDAAVREYTEKFDGVTLDATTVCLEDYRILCSMMM